MKLPPAYAGGLSGARSGERKASKEITFLIVPLDPAYKAGLAADLPVKSLDEIILCPVFYFHCLSLVPTSDKNEMHFKSGDPSVKNQEASSRLR